MRFRSIGLVALGLALAWLAALIGVAGPVGSPRASAAASALTLKSVTVDHPPSSFSPTWSYGTPDPGGSANWDTSTYTGTYSFPLPHTIPADGTTVKLLVSAYTKSSAPHNTSFSASEGITGSLVPGGNVTVTATACGNCDPGYQTANPKSANEQVALTPGGASSATLTVALQDGPVFTYTYEASAPPPPPPGGTAHVGSVSGEVTVKHRDGTSEPLTRATVLRNGDELSTGVDSSTVLVFADGMRMTVNEMTQILVADLLSKGTRQAVTVQLRLGEVSAQVNPKKAFETDFKVSTPSGTTSVRGSAMRVFYDPTTRISIMATLQDRAYFKPKRRGARTITIPAGKEIAVRAKGVPSRLAPIGKAGARGGIDIEKAHDLVLVIVNRATAKCQLTTTPGTAPRIQPAGAKGWTVTITLRGRVSGTTSWLASLQKVTPTNSVAKQIATGC